MRILCFNVLQYASISFDIGKTWLCPLHWLFTTVNQWWHFRLPLIKMSESCCCPGPLCNVRSFSLRHWSFNEKDSGYGIMMIHKSTSSRNSRDITYICYMSTTRTIGCHHLRKHQKLAPKSTQPKVFPIHGRTNGLKRRYCCHLLASWWGNITWSLASPSSHPAQLTSQVRIPMSLIIL